MDKTVPQLGVLGEDDTEAFQTSNRGAVELAQLRLDGLKVTMKAAMQPFEAAINEAEVSLRAAKDQAMLSQRVKVTKTCNRGCCVEWEYEGTIMGINDNSTFRVMTDDGRVDPYVSRHDTKNL